MVLQTAIDRYLFRLIIVPLFGTLVVAAMLLLLEKMLTLFDFVVTEGGPVSVVWRMLGNLIPEYLSLGIPIGVALGILLAMRQLALSSELDALNSVGIGYGRMLRVPFLFATFFAIVNLWIVGFLQPYSRYAYEGLQFELRSGALGASIKVGEFAQLGDNTTLRVEESFDQGADLRGVFFRSARAEDNVSLSVSAARGQFLMTDDRDIIILRLKNGTLVQDNPGLVVPRVLNFTQYDLPIPLPEIDRFRGRGGEDRERTLPELWRVMQDSHTGKQELLTATATFHRRVVMSVVMFLLPFLATALAVPPKRSSSAVGVILCIVILVTYHKISEYGERMGSLGRVDPVLAQWLPYALFSALCLWFYYVLAYRPGGQPIGAIDKVSRKLGGLFRRLRKPAEKVGLGPLLPEAEGQTAPGGGGQ